MSEFLEYDRDNNNESSGPVKRNKKGLNMVMLIQVPLKQKRPMHTFYDLFEKQAAAPEGCMKSKSERSNVENAVISHGKVEGPFTEIDGLAIERDPAYPIRVTVQFYKATDNGVISRSDMEEIAEQLKKVYCEADYVGSLVTGGCTGRPTEYTGDKNEPSNWWTAFWRRHNSNMADMREVDKGIYLGW
jgi:hypothetical protein